jgi:SWI/SNF-related matrix-associated actin-dependent regulator 1 of chromatin subfamily A
MVQLELFGMLSQVASDEVKMEKGIEMEAKKETKVEQTQTPEQGFNLVMDNIQEHLIALDLVCDGAVTEDGQGFSKSDSSFGKSIAHVYWANWTKTQAEYVSVLMKKYRRQIGEVEVPSKEEIEANFKAGGKETKPVAYVNPEKGQSEIYFRYDWEKKSRAGKTGALTFDKDRKLWVLKPEISFKASERLQDFLSDFDFHVNSGFWDNTKVAEKPAPAPEPEFIGKTMVREFKGYKYLYFDMPYNPEAQQDLKDNCCGWWNKFEKHWNVKAGDIDQEIFANLLSWCKNWKIETTNLIKLANELGLTGEIKELVIDFSEFPMLKDYQKVGVEHILKNKKVLLGDQMGLGKTLQAICSFALSGKSRCLCVVPNTLKLNWKEEFQKWTGDKFNVQVISSKTKVDSQANVLVINYDILKKRELDLIKFNPEFLVVDESHYVKNRKAERSKALKRIMDECNSEYRLLMSGTPIMNRPSELPAQLNTLGILNKFAWGNSDSSLTYNFEKRYCAGHRTQFGWDNKGSSNIPELKEKLVKYGYLRRETREVINLPGLTRKIAKIKLDNEAEYRQAEADFLYYMQNLSEKELKSDQALHLQKITELRQVLLRGKFEAGANWVREFIENEKLVLFVHHQWVVDELRKWFPGAGVIDGRTSIEKKNEAKHRFQNDPDNKLIIISINAGREGLTLTSSCNVAFLELGGWSFSSISQAEARCLRIGQTREVTSWFLLGDNTLDDNYIFPMMESKQAIFNDLIRSDKALNLDNTQTSYLQDLFKELSVKQG